MVIGTWPVECFTEGNALRVDRAASAATGGVLLVDDGVILEVEIDNLHWFWHHHQLSHR